MSGNELKLVYPQIEVNAQPNFFQELEFEYFFLQPMDGDNTENNTKLAIEYCLKNPQWRLSIQSHKIIGIP